MTPLPKYRPRQLTLGPLESEILNIIWDLDLATVKDVLDRILADPDRELAYASVMTVLRRLQQKGWLSCEKQGRIFYWQPLVSRQEAKALEAYHQLNRFLEVGTADIVAAFADELDRTSQAKIEAIAARLKAIRQARETE